MEKIGNFINFTALNKQNSPHELSTSVDEILRVVGKSMKYGYTYWLGKVKRSGLEFTRILEITKEVERMDSKYNKGGRITNILTEYANKRKNKVQSVQKRLQPKTPPNGDVRQLPQGNRS